MDDDLAFSAMPNTVSNLRKDVFNKEQFEQMESTGEYMETHYYNTKIKGSLEAFKHLPLYNLFWSEYA